MSTNIYMACLEDAFQVTSDADLFRKQLSLAVSAACRFSSCTICQLLNHRTSINENLPPKMEAKSGSPAPPEPFAPGKI
jgi:hypothetical protein